MDSCGNGSKISPNINLDCLPQVNGESQVHTSVVIYTSHKTLAFKIVNGC